VLKVVEVTISNKLIMRSSNGYKTLEVNDDRTESAQKRERKKDIERWSASIFFLSIMAIDV